MIQCPTYKAISPRLAIRIESNDLIVFGVLVVDDTARDVPRVAVGVKRGTMRRRDERVMTMGEQPFQL